VLQRVIEAGAGENRAHLDLGDEPRSGAAERLTALGAILITEHSPPGAAGRSWPTRRATSSASPESS